MDSTDENRMSPKPNGLFLALIFAVIVLVILGAFTLLQRKSQYRALAKETESLAIPTVAVIRPAATSGLEDMVLPGTLQAYVESPIYARTSGYLKKWYCDIGTRVHKGQLLADIDAPEIDQQLSQARADLGTTQANARLSEITSNRYADLLKSDGVSRQEVDNAAGDFAAKKAMVQSSEANVRRLQDLESFKHIYAPFSGVITRRNVDTGTLINSGNGGSTQQLFFLAQTDPIRVYLTVPETYSSSIRDGLGAYLELAQFPGEKFQGKVVRTSQAIDTATRTLLTEVDVPNKDGRLLPGGFAQVHLQIKMIGQRLQVPVNALLFRAEGLRAIVVDGNHKIHLHPLTIGRDYGSSLEVLSGLNADDWIVLNPADSLDDGQEVRVKQVAQPPVFAQPPPDSAGTRK
ncbi:MAG: efflux RND transporter periplasmic adaptor subunit [Candidatus Acidiferrum sp.]